MKGLVAIGLICVAGVSLIASIQADGPLDNIHWELYKKSFGKVYADAGEEALRRSLFLETKRRVEQHNADLADKLGFEMGYSHLSDWTSDELSEMMGGPLLDDHLQNRNLGGEQNKKDDELPQSIRDIMDANIEDLPDWADWRYVPNRVSSVKDQGKCRSSYAFAAAGVLEAQQVNVTGEDRLIPLSAQNLIDCSNDPNLFNQRCQGGEAAVSFLDVARESGIMSEHDYPYVDSNTDPNPDTHHKCNFNASKSIMNVKGYYTMRPSELELWKFVAQYGPVACQINASPALLHYKSGIFSDPRCKNELLTGNHSVLVVGYGSDYQLGDYWIVKNSWGADWGEQGYFRLARDRDNMCGIVNLASIAVLN